MGIFDSNYKIEKWKYRLDLLEIYINGESKPISIPKERLMGMSLIEDYENWVFPVFRITLVLASSTYLKIVKNKDNARFHIRIHKYFNYLEDVQNPQLNRISLDDMFSLILDDENEDMDNKKREDEMKNDFTKIKRDDSDDLHMVDNRTDFFLYKKDIAVNLKKQINKVFKDATVSDVIAFYMREMKLNNIVMSLPTNTKKHEWIILPDNTILKGIKFLDTYYGIYDVGSLIFFSFDKTYILRYEGACSAYERGELTDICIVIPEQGSSHIATTGILSTKINDRKKYISAEYQSVGTRNDSISKDLLDGNNITVVENFDGNVSMLENDVKGVGSGRTKNQINKTQNPWIGKTYIQQKKMNEIVVDLRLADYDIAYLRPNKCFNILFEDHTLTKKYDGRYLLCSVESTFVKEGDYMIISSLCRFKKDK